MNDALNGLAMMAGFFFVLAVAATFFFAYKRRRIAEQMETERQAASHPAS